MNTTPQDQGFLGRGWKFPPRFNAFTHSAETNAAAESIRQSINLIFSISPGERQMLPEFGCDLKQFVFAPIDSSIETMIQTVVAQALLNYEPRITVEQVVVEAVGEPENQRIEITVTYLVRSTNQRFNLVYPYYLNEANAIPQ